MTKMSLTRLGEDYELLCEGHADDARVCAAISCLVESLDTWLRDTKDAYAVEKETRPGFAQVRFRAVNRQACEAIFLFLRGAVWRLAADAEHAEANIAEN